MALWDGGVGAGGAGRGEGQAPSDSPSCSTGCGETRLRGVPGLRPCHTPCSDMLAATRHGGERGAHPAGHVSGTSRPPGHSTAQQNLPVALARAGPRDGAGRAPAQRDTAWAGGPEPRPRGQRRGPGCSGGGGHCAHMQTHRHTHRCADEQPRTRTPTGARSHAPRAFHSLTGLGSPEPAPRESSARSVWRGGQTPPQR